LLYCICFLGGGEGRSDGRGEWSRDGAGGIAMRFWEIKKTSQKKKENDKYTKTRKSEKEKKKKTTTT